jgi:hypothetical protein
MDKQEHAARSMKVSSWTLGGEIVSTIAEAKRVAARAIRLDQQWLIPQCRSVIAKMRAELAARTTAPASAGTEKATAKSAPMDAKAYFRHIRSLGAFRAIDAIKLAREAAALDHAAAAKRAPGPEVVAREVMPDNSNPLRLSFGVKVY